MRLTTTREALATAASDSVILLAAFVLATVLAFFEARRVWRTGVHPLPLRRPWMRSPRGRRAAARAGPVVTVLFTPAAALLLALEVTNGGPLASVAEAVAVALFNLALVFGASTSVLGRPRWAIPPPRRADPTLFRDSAREPVEQGDRDGT